MGEVHVLTEGEPNAVTLSQLLDRVLHQSLCPPARRGGGQPDKAAQPSFSTTYP